MIAANPEGAESHGQLDVTRVKVCRACWERRRAEQADNCRLDEKTFHEMCLLWSLVLDACGLTRDPATSARLPLMRVLGFCYVVAS
jgi:hypothetical protein